VILEGAKCSGVAGCIRASVSRLLAKTARSPVGKMDVELQVPRHPAASPRV